MSLQFIFGNSGSGKSGYLYQNVLKQAEQEPWRNFLVLVPEQFTMQTQRELVRLQKQHAIMNVDVLSFERLAYRVFDELGIQNLIVLEETGKNLVLRKVAEEKKDKLNVLGGAIHKMGYIGEVKSLISELTQYNISPNQLEEFLLKNEISETLRLKLEDILVLYRGFQEYLEGTYITSEEILSLLCDVAVKSKIIADSVIVFDEYTGFTPIQNQLFGELLVCAKKIIVTVTIDSREDFYHSRGIHELFAMSKKTITTLQKIAYDKKIPMEESIVLSEGQHYRYKESEGLFFMEQNLFRSKKSLEKCKGEEISLLCMKNPKAEILYVAKEIARLVREEGFAYKDIAVVTGDVTQYANYIPEAFAPFQIPYFIDQTKNILFHPLTEFIRAVLEVVETDFAYESVFRFLRSGLSGIEEAQIDRLENYVIAKGIRGRKKWNTCWSAVTRSGKEDFEELNEIRIKIVSIFEPLFDAFHTKKTNTKEQTMALYQMLVKLQIEQQLKQKELFYQKNGEQAKAKEYAQIYKIVIDLLDKVVALLGEETLSIREYSDILDAGFEAAKVGIIPPENDKIMLGDIERTRLNHIKVLFFVGVNDGIVPKSEKAGGIISQFEREKMMENHLELAPGAREKVFIQKFYLYLNMTKPSHRLYVSFSKISAEGKALRCSYLIRVLQKMFDGKKIQEIEEEQMQDECLSPESSMPFFLDGLQKIKQEKKGDWKRERWNALANWYLLHPEYSGKIETLLEAAYLNHTEEPIGKAVVQALYGTVLENSVTRLETFAECAFRHYLIYGLRLQEREEQNFASMDMGNIYHMALEYYAKELEKSGNNWFNVPKELQEQLVEESMRAAVEASNTAGTFETAGNRYLLNRMKETFRRTIWALTEQVQKGRFVPSEFEISFQQVEHLDAVHFSLSEEEKMRLRGRIDRVDVRETDEKVYIKIIDYKSGNTTFSLLNLYHGLQLQLVVYLNVAMAYMEKKHRGKEIEPAGLFYYHIENPMIDGTGLEDEENIKRELLSELKLNGLVNENPEIYREMDIDFTDTSDVIPVALKSDGTLKATSKTASTQEFQVMSEYANSIIKKIGRQILDGDVSIRPYLLDNRTGCDNCPYHTVCCFDAKLPEYVYRRLEKIEKDSIILEKMKGNE